MSKEIEKTDYSGIPLAGDDLDGGGAVSYDDLSSFGEIAEAEIGAIQELPFDDVPLAGGGEIVTRSQVEKEEVEEKEEEKSDEKIEEKSEESKELKGKEEKTEEKSDEKVSEKPSTFKVGEHEFPLDTKLSITEDYQPTLKDAIERLKTENRITQDFGKLSELKRLQEELPQREAKISQQIQSLKHAMAFLDGTKEGQRKFLISYGIDPYEYEEKLRQEFRAEIERESQLSEEERLSETHKRRAEHLEAKEREFQEKQEKEALTTRLFNYGKARAEAVGLTWDELERVNADLLQRVSAVQAGTYTPGAQEQQVLNQLMQTNNEARIDYVIQIAQQSKVMGKVGEFLDKYNPELKNNNDIVNALFGEIANPYRTSEPAEEELTNFIKIRFPSLVAKSESDNGSDPKKESKEQDDEVTVVEDVHAGPKEEEGAKSMQELLSIF